MPDLPEPPDVVVVLSVTEAARHLASGDQVVLLADPDVGRVVRPACGRGRLAVLVGDPDDPLVRATGAAMAGELFGSRRRRP